jgi:radical SAM protein with 4Fe4S-binding SPASM domain
MTLSRFNVGQVERTFAACQRRYPRLTWDDFHLNLAQVSEHYYGNSSDDSAIVATSEALPELRAYQKHRRSQVSLSHWIERRYLKLLERYLERRVTPVRCHALRSSCFVDPWGTVFPCISYTRPLGRLRETDMMLDPIWNAAETAVTQKEIWNGQCPQCWTACEAYQSILGNIIRPFDRGPVVGTPPPLSLHTISPASALRSDMKGRTS